MANRTASLLRNVSVGRPPSAAATAMSRATVTFSGSSSPVVKLMAALFPMALTLLDVHDVTPSVSVGGGEGAMTGTPEALAAAPDPGRELRTALEHLRLEGAIFIRGDYT